MPRVTPQFDQDARPTEAELEEARKWADQQQRDLEEQIKRVIGQVRGTIQKVRQLCDDDGSFGSRAASERLSEVEFWLLKAIN